MRDQEQGEDVLWSMCDQTGNHYEALAAKLNVMGSEFSASDLKNSFSRGDFPSALLLLMYERFKPTRNRSLP